MFDDVDIKNHVRSLGFKASIANYGAIGIPDEKNPGMGKTPHFAGLRAKNQKVYTLESTRDMSEGSLLKPIHWARTWESEK